jgi:hypothetical protein
MLNPCLAVRGQAKNSFLALVIAEKTGHLTFSLAP